MPIQLLWYLICCIFAVCDAFFLLGLKFFCISLFLYLCVEYFPSCRGPNWTAHLDTDTVSWASFTAPSTALHCTALHCTALHCTAQMHCTLQHCTALPSTALDCAEWTGLNCLALHCTTCCANRLFSCPTKTDLWPLKERKFQQKREENVLLKLPFRF